MSPPAQLAEHRSGRVDVDSLADQRGTVTVLAPLESGDPLVDTAAKQGELQIWNIVGGSAHRDGGIRRR
jgi:hypothetical protein